MQENTCVFFEFFYEELGFSVLFGLYVVCLRVEVIQVLLTKFSEDGLEDNVRPAVH